MSRNKERHCFDKTSHNWIYYDEDHLPQWCALCVGTTNLFATSTDLFLKQKNARTMSMKVKFERVWV